MKKIQLTSQILIAMILGLVAGSFFGERIAWIQLIGDLFLRGIQMAVVVMIMGAVIEAVGQLNPKELGKVGGKLAAWFVGGTLVSAAVGLLFAQWIRPGEGLSLTLSQNNLAAQTKIPSLRETILNFVPSNIMKAMSEGNMIQVIIFALFFGYALSLLSSQKEMTNLKESIHQFNQIIIEMIKQVMKLAPIGIFALLAGVTGKVGLQIILPLVKFLLTMGVATIVVFVGWLVLVGIYCQVSPILVLKNMWRMSLVAFTTTSSSITLPIEMEDQENKLGVSKRISGVAAPLAMAMNSNGLAIYLSIAVVTLSQIYNLQLSTGQLLQTIILSTLCTFGTVTVPGGGLVALAIVVPALGLPLESVALLAGVDWFSGMFRTLLNVDGDTFIAMLIAKDEKELDYRLLKDPTLI